jgi:23S rRNA (guanosine2251-2'-O)-methyltransferase
METHSQETLFGRRPVLEALRSGRTCQRLLVARGTRGEVIDEIFTLARDAHVPYDLTDRLRLDKMVGAQHQGVVAIMAARDYAAYDDVLSGLDADSAFLVFLDEIQDPHNVGAIIRSAHAAGADAVILQERHAAGLTPAAVKASAGAVEHVPVCRVTNLQRSMEQAREAGIWLMGLAAEGSTEFTRVDWRVPCSVVIGSEGKGLRRLVRETCDDLVRIPMARSQVGSLNASVAAGLVLYEVYRQRRAD